MKTVIACLAAVVLTTHVAHADVAHLSCSGTYDTFKRGEKDVRGGDMGAISISVSVDISKGTIAVGDYEPWKITKQEEDYVRFEGSDIDVPWLRVPTGTRLYMKGWINRVSGEAAVYFNSTSAHGADIALMQLTCKSAQPLF
jgi:hypothetical protein